MFLCIFSLWWPVWLISPLVFDRLKLIILSSHINSTLICILRYKLCSWIFLIHIFQKLMILLFSYFDVFWSHNAKYMGELGIDFDKIYLWLCSWWNVMNNFILCACINVLYLVWCWNTHMTLQFSGLFLYILYC